MENEVLAVRPLPISGESLRTYLLRLCEENLLDSPRYMLQKAGASETSSRNALQPLKVLTNLTGHKVETFKHLSDRHPSMNTSQISGHPISPSCVRLTKPQICPDCIRECGFIPAMWEIVAYTHCHVHNRPLITHCPHCSQQISWQRPGLLKCKCEGSLSDDFTGPIDQGVIELMKVISALMNGETLRDRESKVGMPLTAMTNMSINSLTGIVHTLGALKLQLDGITDHAKGGTNLAEITAAVNVFSDWPNGFFRLLKLYRNHHGELSIAIRKQFSGILARIFKMGYPKKETSFLETAFTRFAQMHWDTAHLSEEELRQYGLTDHRGRITINEYAKTMGLSPFTVKSMLKQNRLKSISIAHGALEKKLIDLAASPQLSRDTGPTRSLQCAAKFLGIPAPLLAELRKNGVFKVSHFAKPFKAYAHQDLVDFSNDFLSVLKTEEYLDRRFLINLNQVFRQKISKSIKATIITKIMTQEITVFGPSKGIGGSYVIKSDVDSIITTSMEQEDGFCLVKTAAQDLGVSNSTIKGLFESGRIMGHKTDYALKIKRATLEMFKQSYIPLSEAAGRLKSNSMKLLTTCNSKGIEILRVPSYSSMQSFIRREDLGLILP